MSQSMSQMIDDFFTDEELKLKIHSYLPAYPLSLFHADGTQWPIMPEFYTSTEARNHAVESLLNYAKDSFETFNVGDCVIIAAKNNLKFACTEELSVDNINIIKTLCDSLPGTIYRLESMYFPANNMIGEIDVNPDNIINRKLVLKAMFIILFNQLESRVDQREVIRLFDGTPCDLQLPRDHESDN